MPEPSKPWPIDDREIREGYIVRDLEQYQRLASIACDNYDQRSQAARLTLLQHGIAVKAMLELRAVLQTYMTGPPR